MSLKRLNINTHLRTVSSGGPFSADIWNDTLNELSVDLSALAKQWNQLLVPMFRTIPDGTQDTAVNAYVNGLDSRTIYANSAASISFDTVHFYNLIKNRPYTIYEVLTNIFNDLASGTGGTGGGSTTIINTSGGLTDAQKERIGINVFDSSLTSSNVSIDGKADTNNLNIIQIAKDLYGNPGWVLNGNGNPILTNSNMLMVDALLELHNGNWSNDITLSHANIPEIQSILTFIGQGVGEVFPTFTSFNLVSNGSTLENAISQLDAGIRINLFRAYNYGSTASDQSINPLDARGGPLRINGIVSSAGTWTGTAPLIVNIGNTVTGGSEKTGHVQFKNSTPTSTGLTDNPHLAIRVNDTVTTTVKDAIQLESFQFAGGTPAAGYGIGIGFGSETATGSGVSPIGMGRVSAVLLDAAAATFTAGVSVASMGEANSLPTWDNGAITLVQSKVQTTNNTETVALSIPLPNSTIRVMSVRTNIIGTTSNGLNYASFVIEGSLSTAIGVLNNLSHLDDFGGTGNAWSARLSYSSSNINVLVSGVNATTINWRVGTQLFGIIA